MVATDINTDTNDHNHTAALERHTIARMEVVNLVSQMQETLSTIHQTISSLSTAEHDARLDELEQDRDKHLQAIEAAFADESSAINQKRKAERGEILERRRKEDEERERKRRLEDEEMAAKARKEDEERDKHLKIHTKEVEDKTDALMAQVEEEATRMLAEAGDKLKALEERRKDINRRLDEQLQMPLPPPPSRTRRIARAAGNNTETKSLHSQAEAVESKRSESLPVEAVNAQPMSNPLVKAHEDDSDAESVPDEHPALSRQSSTETLPPTTYSPEPADVTLAVPGLNITTHKEVEDGKDNALGVMSRSLSPHHDQDEDIDAALADMPHLSRVNSRDPSAEEHAQTKVDADDTDSHAPESQDEEQRKPAGHARSLTAELAWWEEQQKNGMSIPDIVGEVSDEGEGDDARAELSMPKTIELPVSRRPSLADGAEIVAALDLSEVTKGLGVFDKDALPAPLERHIYDVSRRSSLAEEAPSPIVLDMNHSSRRSSLAADGPSVVARDVASDVAQGHAHKESLEEVPKERTVARADTIAEGGEVDEARGHIEPHSSPEPGIQEEAGSFSPRASGADWPLRHDNSPTPDTQSRREFVAPELTLDTAVLDKAADTAQQSSPISEQHARVAPDVSSPASTADNNFQTASVATPVSHIEFMSKQAHDELDMVESSPVDVISIGSPSERDSFKGPYEHSRLTADTSVVNTAEHSQHGNKEDVASEAGSVSAADEHDVVRALQEDSELQPIEVAAGSAEHVGLDADQHASNVQDDRDSISGDEHLEPMSKSLSEELQQDESSEDPETLFDDDPLAATSHDGTATVERAIHTSAGAVEAERDDDEQTDVGQVKHLLHDQQNLNAISRAASEVGDNDDPMSEDETPVRKVDSRLLADELATKNMREEKSDSADDEESHHEGVGDKDGEKELATQVKPEAETAVSAETPVLAAEADSHVDRETSSLEEQSSVPSLAQKEVYSDNEQAGEAHPSATADAHDVPVTSPKQASDLHDHDTVNVPAQASNSAAEHEDSDHESDSHNSQAVHAVEASDQTQKVDEVGPDDESTLPLPTGLTDAESPAFFTPLESTGLRSSYMAGSSYEEHARNHAAAAQLDGPTDGIRYDDEDKAHLEEADDELHHHSMPATMETIVATTHDGQEIEGGMLDTEVAKMPEPDVTAGGRRASVADSPEQDDDLDTVEQVAGDTALKRVATNESFEQDSNSGYESTHHKVELEHRYSATVHGHDYLFDDDNQSSARSEDDDRDSVSDGPGKPAMPTEQARGSLHADHDGVSEQDGRLEDGKEALQVQAGPPVVDSLMQHGQEGTTEEDEPEIPVITQARGKDEQFDSNNIDHVAEEVESTAGEEHMDQLQLSVTVPLPTAPSQDLGDAEETTGPHFEADHDSDRDLPSTEAGVSYVVIDDDSVADHPIEPVEPVSPTATKGLAASRHNPERPQTPEAQAQPEDTIDRTHNGTQGPSSSPTQSPTVAETTVNEPIYSDQHVDMETFAPRDVTNISWSESQIEQQQEEQQQSRLRSHTNETDMSHGTAPELDVEATPMSMRSVSTLSSAPSSPVHAALLGDNHEPVIRDSWPNPASGTLNSFMGGSLTARARGESNLSNVSYSEDYMAQDGYGTSPSGEKPNSGFAGLAPSPMRLWQRREQSHLSTNEEYSGAGYQSQRPVSAMDLSHSNDSTADPVITPTTHTYRNSVPAAGAAPAPSSGGGASSLFQRMRSVFENNSSSSSAPTAGPGSRGASPTVRSRPGSWYSRASTGPATEQIQKDKTEVAPAYDDSYDADARVMSQAEADKSSWYHENSRRREEQGRGRRGGYDDLDVSDEEDSGEDASLLSEENGHSYDGHGYHRYDRHGRVTAGN